jgi:hypothetical protein
VQCTQASKPKKVIHRPPPELSLIARPGWPVANAAWLSALETGRSKLAVVGSDVSATYRCAHRKRQGAHHLRHRDLASLDAQPFITRQRSVAPQARESRHGSRRRAHA